MNKKEFLKQLDIHLKNVDPQERLNIINYYDELISDQIDEGKDEASVINSLGSIEEILAKLNLPNKRMSYDSLMPKSRDSKNILIIILLVLSFPMWIGLVGGLFGIIVGLISVLFALLVSSATFILTGGLSIFVSFYQMTINPYTGFFSLGASLIILGLGLISFPPLVKLSKYLVEKIICFVKWLFSKTVKGGK